MAVDYVVDFDCPVKGELGGMQDFLQVLKDAGRAGTILEHAAESTEPITDDTEFTFARQTPSGGRIQEKLTLREIRKRGDRLSRYDGQCKGCEANVLQVTGGCSGCINYPISAEAEEWLLSRLPTELTDSIRGGLFKAFLKDFGRQGRRVDKDRAGGLLYELRRPPERKWGSGLFGTTRCTSSMILGNVCYLGSVQPLHGLFMCYFLGAVDKVPLSESMDSPTWVLNMDRLPENASIRQIAWLLRALYSGFVLDVPVYVEP
jgi:Fe-S cluster biogenesis protein NfuA